MLAKETRSRASDGEHAELTKGQAGEEGDEEMLIAVLREIVGNDARVMTGLM